MECRTRFAARMQREVVRSSLSSLNPQLACKKSPPGFKPKVEPIISSFLPNHRIIEKERIGKYHSRTPSTLHCSE